MFRKKGKVGEKKKPVILTAVGWLKPPWNMWDYGNGIKVNEWTDSNNPQVI